jgi:glyoxalase family protein
MQLTGIHHLTAVSADIRGNYRFYTRVLGMRLVKRSVNQDDVSAYHLFYADAAGHPGTDLTFFDWKMPRERRGTRSITRTALRVNGRAALNHWLQRFDEKQVTHTDIFTRDGRLTIDFEDPEGQRLSLVDDGGLGDPPTAWQRSAVPEEFQVRGLGPITMSVPLIEPTATLLLEVLNMRAAREYADVAESKVVVYEMGEGGPHAELHVAIQPELAPARIGAGGVHHVAFRTPNEEQYHAWTDRINSFGIPNSGEVDRFWFRSLYLREPNGVLFEIATDGPGFGVDEDPATLGEQVVLPPFLQPHRDAIVANLQPLD